MNAPVDELTMLLGPLPPEELDARKRIRTARSASAHSINRTASDNARAVFWMIAELATAWQFRPAPQATLNAVVDHLRELFTSARHIEELEALLHD